MKLSDKISRLRRSLNYSQTDVAALVEVSKPTYQRWEYGTTQPKAGQLASLAALFGVAPGELLDD